MTKRVIFVNRVYWPSTEATAQILDDLAQGLADKGINVEILTASAGASVRKSAIGNSLRVVRTEKQKGLTIGIWTKLKAHLRFLRDSRHYLKSCLTKDDMVVTMTDPPLLGTILSKTIRKNNARHWHWSQDVYPEVAIAILHNPLVRFGLSLFKPWRNRVWNNADGIVTIGKDMAKLVSNEVGTTTQIKVIPNWAPTSPNSDESPKFRESLGYNQSHCLVIYSGNLGRAHILTPILELAARFRETSSVKFLIIGEGAQKEDLHREAKARSLTNIAFHPAVPLSDLGALLQTADVHLVTMRPECSGTVLPSKFYGIIEARRPVVFIGPTESEIAQGITQHNIGAACSPTNITPAVRFLESTLSEPESLTRIRHRVDLYARNQPGLRGAIAEWTNIINQTQIPISSLPSKLTAK